MVDLQNVSFSAVEDSQCSWLERRAAFHGREGSRII